MQLHEFIQKNRASVQEFSEQQVEQSRQRFLRDIGEAHSEGLEGGSEFIATLPVNQNESFEISQENESKMVTLDRKRMLVVDDNEDAAESLGMLLKLLDAEMHIVNGGPAALARLETFHPDLVLLDIGMPDMDGYEVARRIRARKAMAGTRLVAVTGWARRRTGSAACAQASMII